MTNVIEKAVMQNIAIESVIDEARTLSPIVLFVYNRPWHTQQTIEALQKNKLAGESELFIYSDAPKAEQDQLKVQEVRNYIQSVGGFQKTTIIEREKNWGLANSIIDGVTAIVNRYGKIIVLEDDIVTSPCFLRYMNDALDYYQDEDKVMHISGWNYPIELDDVSDVFFWRVMNCWGWATWSNSWAHFEKKPQKLINEFSSEQRSHFDLDDSGVFWSQIVANNNKKINTWAIFWYAVIYLNSGLCMNPKYSFVDNIGLDGSGVHCGDSGKKDKCELNQSHRINFEKSIIESSLAVEQIKNYHHLLQKSLMVRVINRLSRMLIRKDIII